MAENEVLAPEQAKEIRRLTEAVQNETRLCEQQDMRLKQAVYDLGTYLDSLTDFKRAGRG